MDTIFHIGPQAGEVKRDNHLPRPAVHHSYSINCGWYFLCLYLLSLCLHVTKSALCLLWPVDTPTMWRTRWSQAAPYALYFTSLFCFFLSDELIQTALLKSSHTWSYLSLCNLIHGQDLQDLSTHIHPPSWPGSTPVLLCGLQSSRPTQTTKSVQDQPDRLCSETASFLLPELPACQ